MLLQSNKITMLPTIGEIDSILICRRIAAFRRTHNIKLDIAENYRSWLSELYRGDARERNRLFAFEPLGEKTNQSFARDN